MLLKSSLGGICQIRYKKTQSGMLAPMYLRANRSVRADQPANLLPNTNGYCINK